MSNQLNPKELERLIKEYAKPEKGLGWKGIQISKYASEIAGFIVDNYYDAPIPKPSSHFHVEGDDNQDL